MFNAETANDIGQVEPDLRSALVTGYTNHLLQVVGSLDTYDLCVIGRDTVGSGTLVARNVLSVAVDTHFDVQRRRGLG